MLLERSLTRSGHAVWLGGHVVRGPLGGAPREQAWAEVSSHVSIVHLLPPQAPSFDCRPMWPRLLIVSTMWMYARLLKRQRSVAAGRGLPAQTAVKGRVRRLPTATAVGSSPCASSSSPPGGLGNYYSRAIKTKTKWLCDGLCSLLKSQEVRNGWCVSAGFAQS